MMTLAGQTVQPSTELQHVHDTLPRTLLHQAERDEVATDRRRVRSELDVSVLVDSSGGLAHASKLLIYV